MISLLDKHRDHMLNGASQGPCFSCSSDNTRTYVARQNCGRGKHTRTCCDIHGVFCRDCKMFHPKHS